MSYIREGCEYADDLVWGSGSFELGFCNGTWTPDTVTVSDIVTTEVGTRLSFTPVLSYDTTSARCQVTIETSDTPGADITFNRVFTLKDGGSAASWAIASLVVPANTVEITGNDFALTERFVLEDTGDVLTVTNVAGDDITFSGQSRDFLISDVILDARGTFLTGTVLTQNTIFFNGVEFFIDMLIETITA